MIIVPRELEDEILCIFLSQVDKAKHLLLYRNLRNGNKLCRRALGNQERAQLLNDKAIKKYNHKSSRFHTVFQDSNGINFGSLYFLEIAMPTDPSLSHALGHTLSLSKVTHLNLCCGHRPDFLQDLQGPNWTAVLERLQVFRVKYIRSMEEVCQSSCSYGLLFMLLSSVQNGADPYPWNHALWRSLLARCAALKVFLLKTPLPIEGDPGLSLVYLWTTEHMPCLQRLYLFHGYDEEADIGDNFWIGSHKLYQCVASSTDLTERTWKHFNIRPKDFGKGQIILEGLKRWRTMLEDDVDPYDSNENF